VALSLCAGFKIPISEWLPVAAIFLKLCLVIEFNQLIINYHKATYNPNARLPELNLGTGLFLASSLINHSCDANMYKIFYGTSVVFRARRPISKGEQLTYCYTHPASHYSYADRQRILLNNCKFKCRCEATTETLSAKSQNQLRVSCI
jgi:hypothetical protein